MYLLEVPNVRVYIYIYRERERELHGTLWLPVYSRKKKRQSELHKILVSCTSVVADILVVLNSSNTHSKSL